VIALARAAGLRARGRILSAHSVPEVFYDGGWRMLDASLINYFPKPDGSGLASVDEIMANVAAFYAKRPELKGNDAGLRAFMRSGGWRNGPPILASSPFYDENGWLPAATHGWYSTMQEYDGSATGIYEYGFSQGYRVNVQLREGERLARHWSNHGLHVNQNDGGRPGSLTARVGEGDLRYAPGYGDLAPGRVGNGVHEYDVPLASGAFRAGALLVENLASGAEGGREPALHLRDASAPGVYVVRMPSSYVYLSGEATLETVVGAGGAIEAAISTNHGLDWTPIATLRTSGAQRLDLTPQVFRRYDYRLRLTLRGAGTGIDALRLRHDVQHSQRALPALKTGANRITFRAGPPEGTITLEGSLEARAKGKQLHYTDFHPTIAGLADPFLRPTTGQGSITFPVETPGEMTRLRLGGHFRARDAADAWQIDVSFDDGANWRPVARFAGPTPGDSRYTTFEDVPADTRRALVRWSATQRNTTVLFGMRMDADYVEPRGGIRPVKVTYVWDEGGVEKRHEHVARAAEETYRIDVGARPTLKSLIVELAE